MRVLIYIAFLVSSLQAFAQLVTLPDANLTSAICLDHPEVMDGGCVQLDTALAQNIDHSLDVSGANISLANEVEYFNRIDTLILRNNNISAFLTHIQTSIFWSLHYLDLSNNQIKTFPKVNINTDYTLVDHVYFQNNQATEFQKLWGARDSIIDLNISNNYISEIQDYSMALKARDINFSNNYFTFEDLLPQTNHPQFETVFTVAPQRNVKWIDESYTGKEHEPYTLTIPIDSFVTTNTYKWFFDGQELKTTASNSLVFDSLKLEDAGIYTVEITNSNALLADLTLTSESFELIVNNCMDINNPTIVVNEKCNGARAQFIDDPQLNGVAPYAYELKGGNKVFTGVDSTELELPINVYELSITDANGCHKRYSEPVYVNGFVGCDKNVITPDGDGLQDEYYFEVEGNVKIYNRAGQVIRELRLPKFWDGKTESGQTVPPGKYIIVIDDTEKIELTIVW